MEKGCAAKKLDVFLGSPVMESGLSSLECLVDQEWAASLVVDWTGSLVFDWAESLVVENLLNAVDFAPNSVSTSGETESKFPQENL